jgi:CheY-like chemotaxis protein
MARAVPQEGGDASADTSRRRPSRRAPVILIADDATDTRDLYADYFTQRGFAVVTAHDGAAAVRVALECVPAVIVLDLAMPQIDGITALRRIKADARSARTRVILLTGYRRRQSNAGRTTPVQISSSPSRVCPRFWSATSRNCSRGDPHEPHR